MTANTTRGYPYPEPTDLVTDGATAIEALAEAIDADVTTVAAAVAAAADAAVQKALVDAKGDLITATADNTPARLALGTNGQVLTVDTTTATGLKYATPTSGGSMINQTIRGTITLAGTGSPGGGVTTVTATIATVNTAKSQLRHLGTTAANDSWQDAVRIRLASATQITADRVETSVSTSNISIVSYELTEWT